MTLIAQLRSIVAGLLRRNRIENSMRDEMRFHIEAYTRDLIRSGVPPDDAERRARVEFGGVELTRSGDVRHVVFGCWMSCEPICVMPAGRSPKAHRFPSPQFLH